MTAPRPLAKVFVANRGEIAVRVIRACRDAGLGSVACCPDTERSAPYSRLADEVVSLPGQAPADTYLDADRLVEACTASGADAFHPGYGFLSESPELASAVIDAGITWIGPSPTTLRLLGDKIAARRLAASVGAPLVAGGTDPLEGPEDVVAFAAEHGLPVAIKAAFGGGGRGLRVARSMEEIPALFAAAVGEATAAFGRGECLVERYLERARHVEAQILGDLHGNVVTVGTRDCSLQRRHQKLVEEAPAPFLTDAKRATIHASARAIGIEAGYHGAGTVEYLLGEDGTVSFLEVNARLQVEHPVTEETSGVDLVREQLRIAAGEPLGLEATPDPRGHAIEFRINAEDPRRGFVPGAGTVTRFVAPGGPGVRVDAGVESGSIVGGQWDSLLAKVIVRGKDRAEALERSRRVLDEMTVDGVATVLPFHRALVRADAFVGDGEGFSVHTRWIEEDFDPTRLPSGEPDVDGDAGNAGDPGDSGDSGESGDPGAAPRIAVRIGGRRLEVAVPGLATLARAGHLSADDLTARRADSAQAGPGDADGTGDNAVLAPMQGTVIEVAVGEGDRVDRGDVVAVVEAMKMQNAVLAPMGGTVTGLVATVGQSVGIDELLCRIDVDPS